MDLTRCTTITDQGFKYWGNAQFTNLRKLCLADCTYLTDNAIVHLTNAAKNLEELDLVSVAKLKVKYHGLLIATRLFAAHCQIRRLRSLHCSAHI
jgi:F-box/leucine-rich repeat protein 7